MNKKNIFHADDIDFRAVFSILKSNLMPILIFSAISVVCVASYLFTQKDVFVLKRLVQVTQVPMIHKDEIKLIPLENVMQTILAVEAQFVDDEPVKFSKVSDELIEINAESSSLSYSESLIKIAYGHIVSRQNRMLDSMKSYIDLNKDFYNIENKKIRRTVYEEKRKLVTLRGIYESYRDDLYEICSKNYLLMGSECSGVLNNLYYRFLVLTHQLEPAPLLFLSEKFVLTTDPLYRDVRKEELQVVIDRFVKEFKGPTLIGKQKVEPKLTIKKKILMIALSTLFSICFISFYFLFLARVQGGVN